MCLGGALVWCCQGLTASVYVFRGWWGVGEVGELCSTIKHTNKEGGRGRRADAKHGGRSRLFNFFYVIYNQEA